MSGIPGFYSIAAFVLSTLVCPTPVLINWTLEAWTIRDYQIVERAKQGCKDWYTPRHCPVKFIKIKPQSYHVICERKK